MSGHEGELEAKYFGGEVSAPEPGEDASEAEWLEWADSFEEAPEEQPQFAPPVDERLLSQEQWDFDLSQRTAAINEVETEANQAERLAYVQERADGFGNQEVYARVDQQIVEAQGEVYRQLLASGWTELSAREHLATLDYDPLIDMAIKGERDRAFADTDPSLRMWNEGRKAQAEGRAREGRSPLPNDVMGSKAIEKLARVLSASVERQEQWQRGVEESYKRQLGIR